MTITEIKEEFYTEFGTIADKFTIIEEYLVNLSKSEKKYIYNPGVYVFCLDGNVIKVGRHLTNSRKRALEHIRDNTANEELQMASLKENVQVKVLLFNLKKIEDSHWSASVEMFLERKLNPIIKLKRQG